MARTSAQGSGPRRSPGQDWTPAQGGGLPSDQGYGRPCAQGVGPLPHQGKGGVCNTNSEPSEPANSASESSINSVDSADSETNDQIYNFGSLTIVLNTILCFIATKKLWARMLLCEQLKKHYAPEDIAEAHNIVIELSDARRPRLTTRDTKRMINVTVHTILDDLVDNKNIIFASTTTEAPSDKIPPVKKQGISTPFTKIFTKTKSEGTQTHTVPADPTSGDSLNVLQNKVDVLMEMFMKQQATLNSLFENEEGMSWRSPARKSGRSDSINSLSDASSLSPPPYQIPPDNVASPNTSCYQPFPFCSPIPSP